MTSSGPRRFWQPPLPSAVTMRVPYVYQQALSFLGVMAFFGALGGALWAAARGGLR